METKPFLSAVHKFFLQGSRLSADWQLLQPLANTHKASGQEMKVYFTAPQHTG